MNRRAGETPALPVNRRVAVQANRRAGQETRAPSFPLARPAEPAPDPASLLGNPLRALTPAYLASLFEAACRGQYTRLQWLMYHIEKFDPDLYALKQRRLPAVSQLPWAVKLAVEKAKRLGLEDVAEQQKSLLVDYYESVENLYAAIEHLQLAVFRGYAHLSLQGTRLEPLDQWWFLRDGLFGDWYYNPSARATSAAALGDAARLRPGEWLVREEDGLLWIACLKWIRSNHSQRFWDAFLETVGKQGVYITAPGNLPADQVTAFQNDAANLSRGGGGVLPNGTDVKWSNAQRGLPPFEARLRHLQESLVLAGTGGLLTMLAQPTGIGQGATDAHDKAFASLARRDARRISELFQQGVDRPRLAAAFPGQPVLAYWELEATETPTPSAYLDDAVKASQAGLAVDPDELSEKTGYTLTRAAAPAGSATGSAGGSPAALSNRGSGRDARAPGGPELSAAIAAELEVPETWLKPVATLLQDLAAKAADASVSDAELAAAVAAAQARLPELLGELGADELADVFERALGAAAVAGVEAGSAGVSPAPRRPRRTGGRAAGGTPALPVGTKGTKG